jgi:hypothetical protein
MNKMFEGKFAVWAGLALAVLVAGCGSTGGADLKGIAPEKAEATLIAPGLYYTELPTGFRLATNYLELEAGSAAVLRAMAAEDPERSELLLQEAAHLEAGFGLVQKAGGAKVVAAAKGITTTKGTNQGQTFLTGCDYRVVATPYDTYRPGSNSDGAYAYAELDCEHGLPIIVEKEVVSAETVIDGAKNPTSATGLPYDARKSSVSRYNYFPQGELLHTCSSTARVQTVLFLGLELPFTEVSEHNNRCRNLIS